MAHPYLQWLTSKTPSIYWHDSAVRAEQLAAFENGAVTIDTAAGPVRFALSDASFVKLCDDEDLF